MDLLTDGLTRSELQHWGSNSKGARDIQGETKLSGFRVRAGGELCPGGTIVSLLSLPLRQHGSYNQKYCNNYM